MRMVWGEFARGGRPQGKPPQAASAQKRRLRRSRSALRAYLGCAAGCKGVMVRWAFLLTMTLFAVIMELHSTKKERIP